MTMSITELERALRQLRLCRSLPYDEVVTLEYRLSQHCTALPDFHEGIRAVLVDKDQKPRWSPPTLAEVSSPATAFHPRPGTTPWTPL